MVARHVGYLSAAYTAGVLLGAPMWGAMSDRMGRSRVLQVGLVGYVVSLLPLLWPQTAGLVGIYLSRAATGFFVAAVVPIVPALVAEYTPTPLRARRFAWLGAMSLLGFLFGPSLDAASRTLVEVLQSLGLSAWSATELVISLSIGMGGVMMLGMSLGLPHAAVQLAAPRTTMEADRGEPSALALWMLNAIVMLVLGGFELGIVLQGQQAPVMSDREISLMFATCSLVMLAVNVALFLSGIQERVEARVLLMAGLILAIAGLAVLALHRGNNWMYAGVALTAAGTGLVLPTVSFMAAGTARRRLGMAMGGLAAAAGLGQTLGSTVSGWLFGSIAQASFAWLAAPLVATLATMMLRPHWWLGAVPVRAFSRAPAGDS